MFLLYDTTKPFLSAKVNTVKTNVPLGAHQGTLRQLNLALVARAVFGDPGALTRADVATATGLTRSTVSRLVDQLVEGRILEEDDPATPMGRGRPGVPLRPAAGTFIYLGLEAKVGNLACHAVDLAGNPVAQRLVHVDLAGTDPAEALAQLADLARETLAETSGRLLGVRVALPGIVDQESGRLLFAPNLGWRDVDIREHLGELAPEHTVVGVANEADCAALAEAYELPGRRDPELGSFMYVSGNVGIGSAVVIDGRLRHGNHGWAGELGHVCVDPAGPPCGCGAYGCLESIVGRSALLRDTGFDSWEALVAAATDPDGELSPKLERAARSLGIALSGALNLLDLSDVVLGGNLSELAPALLPTVLDEMHVRVLSAPFAPVSVTPRPTVEAAGALGAAWSGILDLLQDPSAALD